MDRVNAYSQITNNYYQNSESVKKNRDEKNKDKQVENSSNIEKSVEVGEKCGMNIVNVNDTLTL